MANSKQLQRSQRELLETIGDHPDVVLIRGTGDQGEELSRAGIRALLAERDLREIDLEQLCGTSGHTALIGGGEAFCAPAHEYMTQALAIAERRFERVVVLPSSFDVSLEDVRNTLERTNAAVFAREPESHRQIQELCNARLTHDCALFLDSTSTSQDEPWVPAPEASEPVSARLSPSPWLATDHAVREQLNALATRHHPPSIEPTRDPTGAPRVTAVIISHNRPEFVVGAIHSLIHVPSIPVNVLVLDNNSTARSKRVLTDACAEHPQVEVHFSERNLGCAGGRQRALELTRCELVLFLDDDAELLPGALEQLVSELDSHPEADGVSATVALPDGRISHSGGAFEQTPETVCFTLIGSGLRFDDPGLPASGRCDWIAGTAALIRRALFERHPLDTEMSAYYEDTEWCLRVADGERGKFRRSREAFAVHHASLKPWGKPNFASRAKWVRFIETLAHFYRTHGCLLVIPGVDLFALMPELMRTDGTRDLVGARLVMELASTHGRDWLLMEWMNGGLDPVLGIERTRLGNELHGARTEVVALRAELAAHAEAEMRLQETYHSRLWKLERLYDRARLRARRLRATGSRRSAERSD